MKLRHSILLSLLFISVFLVLRSESNMNSNISDLKGKAPVRKVNASEILKTSTLPTLNLERLIDRTQLIEHRNSNDTRKKNIFFTHSSEPIKSKEIKPQSLTPIVPPAAPPLPFTYLGKKLEAEKWEVYLSRGAETLIVREQSELDSNYRVESIQPPNMFVTYLPLKQIQTMNIGAPD